MLKEEKVKGWKRKINELLDALSPVILSKTGYHYLARVLLEEGFERAMEAVKEFKSNVPTADPKMYRSLFNYVVMRDEQAGFEVCTEASGGLPLNVYPGRIVWIGNAYAELVLSNRNKVFQFVKKHINLLESLPTNVAEYAIVKYAKSGDEGVIKRYVLTPFKEGLRDVLARYDIILKLDERFALTRTKHGKYSVVDLKDLRASKPYSIGNAVNRIILRDDIKVEWEHSLNDFSEVFFEDVINKLARINPALKVLV